MRKKQNKKKYAKFLNKVRKIFKQINISKKKVLAILACSTLTILLTFVTYNLNNPTYMNKLFANVLNNGTPANEAFDDNNFYSCVVDAYNNEFNANKAYSDILTDDELADITSITLSSMSYYETGPREIKSLKGLEKLTGLTSLSIYWLSEFNDNIDVSKNINLERLEIQQNISKIDLSNNVKLTNLILVSNSLTDINLRENSLLQSLVLNNSLVSNIDLSNNVSLTQLDLSNNQLTSIDISQNTLLTSLRLSGNKLNQEIPAMLVGETFEIVDKVILPSNLSMKYKVEDKTIAKVSGNIITALSEGTTYLNADYIDSSEINVRSAKITSNSYKIDEANKIIYTKNDTDESVIKNKVFSSIGEIIIEDGKLKVVKNGNTLLEYTIVNYTVSNYTVGYGFIYLIVDKFDENNIKVNGGKYEINDSDNTLSIKYNDEVLDTFKLTIISSDYYDLSNMKVGYVSSYENVNYLYLGTEKFDKSKINITNATINEDGQATISDGVSYIPVFAAVTVQFPSDINIKDKYIYKDDFSNNINGYSLTNDIYMDGGIYQEGNSLKIKINGNVIDDFKIVWLSTNSYRIIDDYVYIGGNNYNNDNMLLENGKIIEKNDTLEFYIEDDKLIKKFKFISYKIKDYKVFGNSVYVGFNEFDKNKLILQNCDYEISGNIINIKYENVIIDWIRLNTISTDYEVKGNKIYVGVNEFWPSINLSDCYGCTIEENGYSYNVKYGSENVDTIDIVKINTSYEYTVSLKKSNYIYLGGKNIKDLDSFNVINGFYEETNDELIIYDSKDKNYELNRIKLLRITSEKYDFTKSYSNYVYYIYTGFDRYETENGTERIDRTKINLPKGFKLNYDGWANYSICDDITCYETISAVFIGDYYNYKITKDYVYFGFMDYLEPNYNIYVENGDGKLNGDKFDIYTANNVYCTSIPVVAVESYYANEEYMESHEIDGYDYNKELGALYLGTDSFDPLRISKKINAETQYSTDDNKLVIKYDGKEIETINIINLYMPDMYKFIYGEIYTKADTFNKDMVKEITSLKDIDKNKVNIINGKLGVEKNDNEDDDGNIYYTDRFSICPLGYVSKYEDDPFKGCFELGNFNILSDDYNFNKDYIYVGPGELKKNIKFNFWGEIVPLEESLIEGVELAVSDDTIELWMDDTECDDEYINGEYVETCYVNERILKVDEWKIVRATSTKYDLESDKIVLKENEKFDISDIKVVNGKAELKDNMLLIKYKDEIVKKIKIEGKSLNNSTTTKTTSKDGTNKKTTLKKTTTSIKNNINKTTTTKKKNIYPTTTKRIVNDIGSSKQKELNMLYKQGDNKLVIIYLLIMYNLLLMGLIFILKSKFNDKLMSNL